MGTPGGNRYLAAWARPWAGVRCGIRLEITPSSLRLGVDWDCLSLGSPELHPDTAPTPRSHYCRGASLLSPRLLPVLSSPASPLSINCQQMRTHFSAQILPRLPSDLRTKPSSSPWLRRSGKVWPALFWGSFQPKVPPLGCCCLPH